MVVSNIFYFHPYFAKISNLTSIYFHMGMVQPPARISTGSSCFAFCLFDQDMAHHQGLCHKLIGAQNGSDGQNGSGEWPFVCRLCSDFL